jgi:hypothetical protein
MCSVNRIPGRVQPRAVFVALFIGGSILTCLEAFGADAPAVDPRKVGIAEAAAGVDSVFDMVPIPGETLPMPRTLDVFDGAKR